MDEEPWLGAEVLLPRNEEAEWCNDCHQYRLNLRGTEKFEARNLPDNRKALRRLDRQKRLHSGNPQGQLGCLGFSEPRWLRLAGFSIFKPKSPFPPDTFTSTNAIKRFFTDSLQSYLPAQLILWPERGAGRVGINFVANHTRQDASSSDPRFGPSSTATIIGYQCFRSICPLE